MKKTHLLRNGFLALLGLIFSTALWAHGGAAGTDTDQCKFELEKDHWLHYTAYQPKAYPAEHQYSDPTGVRLSGSTLSQYGH